MNQPLTINDLNFQWQPQSRTLAVPSLKLRASEKIMLQGSSGTGKSTLLNLIAGVLLPQSGQIQLMQQQMSQLSGAARDQLRADWLGIIYQQFNLLNYLSVQDNILLPLKFSKRRRSQLRDPQTEVSRLLDALQVPHELRQQPVANLSVGQQQRVAAARALIGKPAVILADEPTSALDPDNRDQFIRLLADECAETNSALILVSHDPALQQHVDRVYRLNAQENKTEVLPC